MEKILKELLFLNILVVLAYLQIDATMIGLYTVLALLDFMSWLMKWWRSKSLSSDRAGQGVAKKVGILMIILALAILLRMLGVESGITISVFIWMFGIGEVISLTGNIYEVSTGKKAPEFEAMDYITLFILEWLKMRLEKVIVFIMWPRKEEPAVTQIPAQTISMPIENNNMDVQQQ
jgi:phage-related holin